MPKHEYTVIHGVLAVPHRAAAFVGLKVVQRVLRGRRRGGVPADPRLLRAARLEATFVHTVGHVAESIADLAEEGKFDLVVMGSRGHGDLANLVLGSVVTKVLAKCSVPVLLIR